MSDQIPKTQQIPVDLLVKVLDYDPLDGILRWKVSRSSRARVGARAGNLNEHGYVKLSIDNTTLLGHRVVWAMNYGAWPAGLIDHINGVRTDNRLENLRACNSSQNAANRGTNLANRSGVKGVTKLPHGSWQAVISANGVSKYLGSFADSASASTAYNNAAKELHGEFMRASEVKP